MKKMLSVFLAIAMLISHTVFAVDFEAATVTQERKIEEITRFLYALAYDAEAFDMQSSDFDTLYIGDPIPAYEVLEEGLEPLAVENYPVFTGDGRLVLMARVLVKDGFVYITAGTDLVSELTAYYENGAQITLVFDDVRGYVLSDGVMETVYTNEQTPVSNRVSVENFNLIALDLEEAAVEKKDCLVATIQATDESYSANASRAAATLPIQYSLDTPRYAQEQNMSCWAACVRSIGRYYTGRVRTEAEIYSFCGMTWGPSIGGTIDNARAALGSYLYPGINDTAFMNRKQNFDGHMSFADYCQNIYEGRPMFAATYPTGTPGANGAAIVLRGYYNYQSTSNVGIINCMDPDSGSNSACNVPTDFSYIYTNAHGANYTVEEVVY